MKEEAREQLRLAMQEREAANEARMQAKRQMEIAEQELANAKKLRQQAQAELSKAFAIRDGAMTRINSVMLQITCQACKSKFQVKGRAVCDDNSLAEAAAAASYMSSVVTEGIEAASPNS